MEWDATGSRYDRITDSTLNSNASWYVLAGGNLTVGADVITIGQQYIILGQRLQLNR
jgi:hypothetical protein